MRQNNDQVGTGGAHLVYHLLHALIADAEREIREHPARVGDGHIGEGLPDHRNFGAATLEKFVRLEFFGRLVPFSVENILPQHRKGRLFHQFAHPLLAQREFPMEGHRIGFQQLHGVHHVLALRMIAGVRPVPCIATIQQQRIGAGCANGVYYRGHAIQTADPAIGLGQGREIIIAQRIGAGAAIGDAVKLAEISAGHMGHRAAVFAHADVYLGFAEIDRL